MRFKEMRGLALGAVLAVLLGGIGSADADDADRNAFETLPSLSQAELSKARAGDATASNELEQVSSNTINGVTTVQGGTLTMENGSLSGGSLNVNLINTGNNNALQASASMSVHITP